MKGVTRSRHLRLDPVLYIGLSGTLYYTNDIVTPVRIEGLVVYMKSPVWYL